jgi:signal transduction histidine kinase
MLDPRSRPGPPRRLHLPRRTARLRLTVLYGAAFVLCGACGATVVAVVVFLYGRLTPPVVTKHLIKHADGPGHTTYVTPTASKAVSAGFMTIRVAGLGQITLDRHQLLIASAVAAAVFVVAAAALGWLLADRVLRPLRTITGAARRISASSLHERLAPAGPDDELKELADTLNNLLARLEASFDAQRRFAANASHELRTPLTRERTLLQVTLADPAATTETWQAISRELLASNAEQERLIEALLTLASSEAGPGDRELVDLAAITSAALAAADPEITRLGLHVDAVMQPAALDGDPLLVQQLTANLIGNAVRHNVPGGDVQVAVGTSDGHAVLSVTNSGQVIPPTEVDRLFQPFHRLGPRRARRDGGHGLGLSIVRAIATAHAATIDAHAQPSGGLAVVVTFQPPAPLTCRLPDGLDLGGLGHEALAGVVQVGLGGNRGTTAVQRHGHRTHGSAADRPEQLAGRGHRRRRGAFRQAEECHQRSRGVGQRHQGATVHDPARGAQVRGPVQVRDDLVRAGLVHDHADVPDKWHERANGVQISGHRASLFRPAPANHASS